MNILTKFKTMNLGKKIYAGLWAITGSLMISLIGLFVGLNNKYSESTPPEKGWTIKEINPAQGVTFPMLSDYKVLVKNDITIITKPGGTKEVYKVGDYAPLGTAILVEDFYVYFDIEDFNYPNKPTTDAKQLYELNEWKTEKTTAAKDATNATAAVGAVFGLSLIGTVFTTVGVSLHEKKRGGKK